MSESLPPEAIRAGYDRSAASYDARFAAIQQPKHDAVLARVPVLAGERVLDLGCGTGLLARRLASSSASRGANVVGLDLSSGMLALGRASLAPVQGDLRALPFRDGSFDVAFAVTSFLFSAGDQVRALTEVRRVLVAGGRAAITLLAIEAPADFERTLAACGLACVGDRLSCGQDVGWALRRG